MTRLSTVGGVLCLAAGVLAACTITQTGNPPVRPQLDPGLVEPAMVQPELMTALALNGLAGAASGASAEVIAMNLDAPAVDPVRVPIESDGSFNITLIAMPGQSVRIYVAEPASRSVPWDVVREMGTGLLPAPRPLAGCLMVEPMFDLGFGTDMQVTISNGCATDVELGGAHLLYGDRGYMVSDGPVRLAPGEVHEVLVTLSAAGPAGDEVLLVDVLAPEVGRVPITLYQPTP